MHSFLGVFFFFVAIHFARFSLTAITISIAFAHRVVCFYSRCAHLIFYGPILLSLFLSVCECMCVFKSEMYIFSIEFLEHFITSLNAVIVFVAFLLLLCYYRNSVTIWWISILFKDFASDQSVSSVLMLYKCPPIDIGLENTNVGTFKRKIHLRVTLKMNSKWKMDQLWNLWHASKSHHCQLLILFVLPVIICARVPRIGHAGTQFTIWVFQINCYSIAAFTS